MRAALLLALFVLPAAAASWSHGGQREPDTPQDESGGWMWSDPDAEPTGARLYFNAFPTLVAATNPNAAVAGSRLSPAPALCWEALLGAWKDCNSDGFVGLAEAGLDPYSSRVLTASDACPPGTRHNDGGLVREILAITPATDPAARIWGDRGAPGAKGEEVCAALPIPRGTTSNTGRLLRYLDCVSEHRLIGVVNTVDNDGLLGLRIDDPHRPEESDSRLVMDLPVGVEAVEDAHESSDHTARRRNDVVLAWETEPSSPGLALEPWGGATSSTTSSGAASPSQGAWRARTAFLATPPLVSRSDLRPEGREEWTFYAAVGASTLGTASRPASVVGVYGSEACEGATSGVRKGWDCDAQAWWLDPYGDAMPRDAEGRALGASAGAAYHFRDVDCFDGTLLDGAPAHASLVQLSASGACE